MSAADAVLAARLCALDPALGGMILRGDGDARDAAIAALRAALPAGAPIRRLPANADDERLLGGVDLAAALGGGALAVRRGLLAEADGGALIVPMAERLGETTAARIAAMLDTGAVTIERDGVTLRHDARPIVVLLDDGASEDERPPAALAERLAFVVELSPGEGRGPGPHSRELPKPAASDPLGPGLRLGTAEVSEATLSALVTTAAALGIDSARAPLLALRAVRASAMLAGRDAIVDEDVTLAARLVLGPRATRLPAAEPDEQAPPPEERAAADDGDQRSADPGELADVTLEAARAALPPGLLEALASGRAARGPPPKSRGGGERRRSAMRGRPAGTRAGKPGNGARLALVETLRAAAPWQKLRRRDATDNRIRIRRDDLRVLRFEDRAELVTIFAVDASGSSALARLAEAKGAIELLLAEAYVQRAEVALIAFRGAAAELLLPPTGSLVRARRALANLPGGGGTPLASGMIAAHGLALAVRARGKTPHVVLLTDGRGNIAADGRGDRVAAQADANAAARRIAADGIATLFIDTAPRPRGDSAGLARAMAARYLPMPYADAHAMHAALRGMGAA